MELIAYHLVTKTFKQTPQDIFLAGGVGVFAFLCCGVGVLFFFVAIYK